MFSSFLHCSLSALFAPPFCLSVTENVHRARFRRGAILLWAVLLYAAQTRVLNVLLLPQKIFTVCDYLVQQNAPPIAYR